MNIADKDFHMHQRRTQMMTWEYDEQGILCSPNGDWLEYGAFGEDTYGLHTQLDSSNSIVFRLLVEHGEPAPVGEANIILNKLKNGWLPVGLTDIHKP